MQASVAIQVLPQGVEGTDEVIRVVDAVIAYIMSEFPDAYVSPFETVIEGDYDHCMRVVAQANHIAVDAGANGVATYVKIFFSPSKGVLTVEQKIGKYHENDAQ
ncbi:thiamine-binding protein [Collinsella sp. AGMB00827]|uniref:Thiamine-binding protein n=1 Tax=Collinsella ureilytica TaxID=2869515 RepID=A0ABS7MJ15_9ACTN|nr:thiamine-binding protein [Collinsella urealyticum]MBY4797282.1 thiamine-binding protein [Collinsella urealyticum]